MTTGPEPGPPRFLSASPQFLVADVVAAAEYYRETLGFEIGPYATGSSPDEPPFFVVVSRDAVQIQLSRSERGHSRTNREHKSEAQDANIWVTDVEALWTEFQERENLRVIEPLKIEPYGIKSFSIEDSSGYTISFAQPVSQN